MGCAILIKSVYILIYASKDVTWILLKYHYAKPIKTTIYIFILIMSKNMVPVSVLIYKALPWNLFNFQSTFFHAKFLANRVDEI